MKNRDIRASNEEDLSRRVEELRKELIKTRMQIATGTALKSPGLVKKSRKTIARILTEIRNKKRKTKPEGLDKKTK